jgi:hypothetical protein
MVELMGDQTRKKFPDLIFRGLSPPRSSNSLFCWNKTYIVEYPNIGNTIGSMSLYGLRPLAKYCLELTFLHITFDTSTVPPFDQSENIISQSSLANLDVDLSPITDPFVVAQFMARFFPNLTKIYTFDESRWNAGGFFSTNYLDDQEIAEHPTEYALFTRKEVEGMLPNLKGAPK